MLTTALLSSSLLLSLDIQGHRGARGLLPPGNTLPGYQKGIEVGVDTLEGDMQITSDGVVIMNHDDTVTASCLWQGQGPEPTRQIQLLTYEQISHFNCHPTLLGHNAPPTVEALIILAKNAVSRHGKPIQLSLEMKQGDPKSVHQYMHTLETLNESYHHVLNDRLILQCFDWDACKLAKILNHNKIKFRTSFLTDDPNKDFHDFIPYIDILSPQADLVTPELMQQAQDEDMMQALLALHIAGLITDYPDRAIAIVNKLL